MSSSPLSSNRHKPTRPPLSPPPPSHRSERLSLSQALIITAGLAGLIGLGSGAVIRFSLATSSNTRFLNPLQTFPALPNWDPQLPQGTADSHYLPSGAAPNRIGDSDSLPSSADRTASTDSRSIPAADAVSPAGTVPNQSSAAFDASSFDAFAARDKRKNSSADPRETLEKGPSIGIPNTYSRDSREKNSTPANLDENLTGGYSAKTTESDGYSSEYSAPDYSTPDYSGADYPGAEPDYSDDAGYENNG